MKAAVIVCTYNRCDTLAKTLESLAASTIPDSVEWEIVVIDNNSSDRTRQVVEDFSRRFPGRFRYAFEPRQGKSFALNRGIRETQADVLAFTDDDVSMEPTWLGNVTADLCSGDWAGVGGRILPQWPCAPPPWFPEEGWLGRAPLGIFDLGPEARPLTDAPFGANMAFRRRVFEKHGGFRTDLGPGPNNKVRNNEDTEFGRRLLTAGERLKYAPAALVYHPVQQNGLQRDYFLAWWFNKGRADIQEDGIATDTKWFICGVPLYLLRKLAIGTLRWLLTLERSRRFTHQLSVWFFAGRALESYHQSKGVRHKGKKLASV